MAGIYIHMPFCKSKCRYCDFPSFAGISLGRQAAYGKALQREIRDFAQKQPERLKAETIYIGGGTPSIVDAEQIDGVLAVIQRYFEVDDKAEITLEANPESMTPQKAKAYRKMGINRISMGLQAAQDRLLKTLGRPHTLADFDTALTYLCDAGFDNLSADLMFGLPGQHLEDVAQSVEHLTAFPVIRHLSCYSLKIEEGTPFAAMAAAGKLDLPDEDDERAMERLIHQKLEIAGLMQYEISNYAIPGFESRHNSRYWTMDDYVGFGLGAASYYNNTRWTNTFSFEAYLEKTPVPKAECHVLSAEEARGDFMFLGLRRNRGVSDEAYRRLFGRSFFDDYAKAIGKLTTQGLLRQQDDSLLLTERGRDLANQVFMEFV